MVLVVVAALAACGSGEGSGSDQRGSNGTAEQTAPAGEQVAPDKGKNSGESGEEEQAKAPKDKTLKLTVPGMRAGRERRGSKSGKGSAENLFKQNTAVHLKGTGFPLGGQGERHQRLPGRPPAGLPGHRKLPGVQRHREVLKNGDEVIVEDAKGTEENLRGLQHPGRGAHEPVRARAR